MYIHISYVHHIYIYIHISVDIKYKLMKDPNAFASGFAYLWKTQALKHIFCKFDTRRAWHRKLNGDKMYLPCAGCESIE